MGIETPFEPVGQPIPLGAGLPDETTVRVATSFDEIEALRLVWSAMPVRNIDSQIDYYLAVARNAEQVIGPCVVQIRRAGRPDMLVVARLENLPVRLKLGYSTLATVKVRAIVVNFEGVLGASGSDDETLAMETLRDLLDEKLADVILLRNVDPESTLREAAIAGVARTRLGRRSSSDRLWMTQLPETFEAFLQLRSSKSRSSFRREDRLLLDHHGDQLRLCRYSQLDEFDTICSDMARVSARTYQGRLGAGFANTPMERALVRLGLSRGTYRCWMLYVGERPIAFWAGMAHGDVFYPTTPGFDPEFGRHSIGRYTMFRMIEDLCAWDGIRRIDFGRGDAQYKSEYAVPVSQACDVWISAKRPFPMMVIGAHSLAGAMNARAKRFAQNSTLTRDLKSRWRKLLTR
jgi:CelD/BcsL family acetyltransferase involved in cellulose biosynthesis